MKLRNVTLALGLSVAVVASCIPTAPVLADTADELAAAEDRLESLGAQLAAKEQELADTTEELETTQYQIDEKSAQIEETRAELAQSKSELSDIVRSSYKTGGSRMLDFIFGSTSAADLVDRIRYLETYSDYQTEVISEVSNLEASLEADLQELEARKSSQEQLIENLNAQTADYEAQVAEAQEVYNELDAQLQAELEAQRNAEIQAALEAAERAEQQQAAQQQQQQQQERLLQQQAQPLQLKKHQQLLLQKELNPQGPGIDYTKRSPEAYGAHSLSVVVHLVAVTAIWLLWLVAATGIAGSLPTDVRWDFIIGS